MAEIIKVEKIKQRKVEIDNQINQINEDLVKLTHEPWVVVLCKNNLYDTIINLLKEAGYAVEVRTVHTDVTTLCVRIN